MPIIQNQDFIWNKTNISDYRLSTRTFASGTTYLTEYSQNGLYIHTGEGKILLNQGTRKNPSWLTIISSAEGFGADIIALGG